MSATSREIAEAVTRITNANTPFVWVRVPRKRDTKKRVQRFHEALQRAIIRAGLFYGVNTTTRKNTPYLLIDKRVMR